MTSADLYILIATVSLVFFTFFGVLALVYLILILRRVHLMMDLIETFFKNWGGSFRDLAARFEVFKDTAQMVAQGIKTVSGIVSDRKGKAKKKRED